MIPDLTPEEKQEKALGLAFIASDAEKLKEGGGSPLEVQTYINGARRELAAQRPDPRSMRESSMAAKKYKDMMAQGRVEGGTMVSPTLS
jgi:hypothetical protein